MTMFPISGIVERIVRLPSWLALLIVSTIRALEASTLGFEFPAEIARSLLARLRLSRR